MNRRALLSYGTSAFCATVAGRVMYPLATVAQRSRTVQVNIAEDEVLGMIPANFIGLGYEISSVAQPNLLTSANRTYVQMVRTLSTTGVIRIGGNTSDYASYSERGKAVSSPKATVVDRESLRHLNSFLDATGWHLIWGLNLGHSTIGEAVEEAQAINAIVKDKLLAFEIGNEVDLFAHEGHRPAGYSFADYLADYRRYKIAIRAKLPQAVFAGPDVAGRADWVAQFAAAEGHDLKLLTEHYYRAGQSAASSYQMLFGPDPKLEPMLQTLRRVAADAKLPYRICETNSFSGGGRPGISGTFGAALWVLDYMFTLASAGASGVNIECGINQLGFVSSYSPMGDDLHGNYTAKPEYFGMLAFSRASHGQRVAVSAQTEGCSLSTNAVKSGRQLVVTVINKDIIPAVVNIRCSGRIDNASVQRLLAPSLESSTGITLAGATVTSAGHWMPLRPESLPTTPEAVDVSLQPHSAAFVTLTLKQ